MNEFKVGDLVNINIDSPDYDTLIKQEGIFPRRVTSIKGRYLRFNEKTGGWSYTNFTKVNEGGQIVTVGPKPPTGAQGLKGGWGCKGTVGPSGVEGPKGPFSEQNGVYSKYNREIIGLCGTRVVIDVYRVLDAYKTMNPILDHLIKKALCAGLRGHKDQGQDLRDILHSAHKALELFEQKEAK